MSSASRADTRRADAGLGRLTFRRTGGEERGPFGELRRHLGHQLPDAPPTPAHGPGPGREHRRSRAQRRQMGGRIPIGGLVARIARPSPREASASRSRAACGIGAVASARRGRRPALVDSRRQIGGEHRLLAGGADRRPTPTAVVRKYSDCHLRSPLSNLCSIVHLFVLGDQITVRRGSDSAADRRSARARPALRSCSRTGRDDRGTRAKWLRRIGRPSNGARDRARTAVWADRRRALPGCRLAGSPTRDLTRGCHRPLQHAIGDGHPGTARPPVRRRPRRDPPSPFVRRRRHRPTGRRPPRRSPAQRPTQRPTEQLD